LQHSPIPGAPGESNRKEKPIKNLSTAKERKTLASLDCGGRSKRKKRSQEKATKNRQEEGIWATINWPLKKRSQDKHKRIPRKRARVSEEESCRSFATQKLSASAWKLRTKKGRGRDRECPLPRKENEDGGIAPNPSEAEARGRKTVNERATRIESLRETGVRNQKS